MGTSHVPTAYQKTIMGEGDEGKDDIQWWKSRNGNEAARCRTT